MNLQTNPLIKTLNTPEFKKNMKAAHIPITSEMYLLLLTAGTILAVLFSAAAVLSAAALKIQYNPIQFLPPILSYILICALILIVGFTLAYTYPQMKAQGRKTQIELDLPYAVTYMQALSTTMTLFSIFKGVAENDDLYGEVSGECAMIVRDVEYFGDDLLTAMRNVQMTTPSPTFSELLNDLAMVFKTGGNMTKFFASKASHYRETSSIELQNTLKTMEIMAEVYVTAFVAGPIAVMIMIVAQNLSGQGGTEILVPLMYIGLPTGAAAMVFVLYIMMPPDTMKITRKEFEQSEYSDANVDDKSLRALSGKYIRNIEAKRQMMKIKEILRNPVKYYISDYQYGLIAGMLCACIVVYLYMTGTLARYAGTYTFEIFISLAIIAFTAPIALAYELRNIYLKRFEGQLPDFLRDIADMKDMGMTLQSAIHMIARSKIGILTSEIRIASAEIKMGTSVSNALYRLEERIGLVSVKRAVSLVIKASEVTDHLREILAIAVSDLEHYLKMKNERFGVSFIYAAIIYLSFGIFLYSSYQINVAFIESFAEFDLDFNIESNIREMFHISLILGLFSGLMAGQLSSNTVLAGLKHSIIFTIMSIVLFTIII